MQQHAANASQGRTLSICLRADLGGFAHDLGSFAHDWQMAGQRGRGSVVVRCVYGACTRLSAQHRTGLQQRQLLPRAGTCKLGLGDDVGNLASVLYCICGQNWWVILVIGRHQMQPESERKCGHAWPFSSHASPVKV